MYVCRAGSCAWLPSQWHVAVLELSSRRIKVRDGAKDLPSNWTLAAYCHHGERCSVLLGKKLGAQSLAASGLVAARQARAGRAAVSASLFRPLRLAALTYTDAVCISPHHGACILLAALMALSASRPRVPNGSSLPTVRLAFIGLCHAFAPMVAALPMPFGTAFSALREADDDLPKDANDPQLWLFLGIAVALVLAGGVFAGLTIAYVE